LINSLNFIIIEKHEKLRNQQQEYFEQCFGNQIKLMHYENLEDIKEESAFIVANEIFDAFPFDMVYTNKNNQLEKAIVKNHTIEFIKNNDPYLKEHCTKYNITKGEVARGYEEFAIAMNKNIQKFEFMTFDYGEKYPRNDFSCRIYSKHKVFPIFDKEVNLEKLYEKSDITYDVNFQHLLDSFENVHINQIDYKTQLQSLVSFGITELLDMLREKVNERTYLNEVNKVKTLLNPTGMGDRFKMIRFRKHN